MAVEERVVIKVEIDADINNDLAAIERRIKALEDRTRSFNNANRDLDKTTDRLTRRFGKMQRALSGFMGVFTKFVTMMGKFSFIALAGQIGLFTAGLLAAKAALITGRAAVKAYDIALKGLSVAAAGAATALAVAAAAMREFQEAQLAPLLGGGAAGRTSSRRFTSGISSRNLGLLGGEASGAITASLARGGIQGSQANRLITQLINLSGGDAKAAQQLASALGSKDFAQARTAVQGAAGFRKGGLAGVNNMRGLTAAVSGGGATAGAFGNVGANMANTFIGTMKTQFADLKGLFADLGEPLLGPFRNAFLQISGIIRNDIISLAGIIQKFGAESFAPTLVTVVESISTFLRKNILEDIGRIEEMGESFVGFFKSVRNFFRGMADFFGKFEPAANVLIDMFRAMGQAGGGRGLFAEFRQLMIDNTDNFIKFGEAVGNVFGALFDRLSNGQTGFFAKLPLINEVLNKLATNVIPSMFNLFNTLMPLLDRLPSALEGLAQVMNMLAPIVETLVSAVVMIANVLSTLTGGGGGGLVDFALGAGMFMGGRKLSKLRGARGAAGAAGGGRLAAAGSSAMSGGRTAVSTFGRQTTSAYQALRHGQGVRGAGRAFGLAGTRAAGGATAGFRAMPALGAALSAHSLYENVGLSGLGIGTGGNAYQSGRFTGMGMASGAMLGASIGSMVPVVGTIAGALVGAAVGGIMEGIAAFRGHKAKIGRSKKVSAAIMQGVTGFQVGSGTAALEQQMSLMEGFSAAVEASKDDMGRLSSLDGDTKEFSEFVMGLGIDPSKVHMDKLFTSLLNDNMLDKLQDNVERANQAYEDQMNNIAKITGTTAQAVADFMQAFGIDANANVRDSGIGVMMSLLNLGDIDRTQSFVSDIDFSTSKIGRESRSASANAALNAFMQGGMTDESSLLDFINKGAIAEVAMGGKSDLAGLSMLLAVEQMQGQGKFGSTDVVGNFGISSQIQQQLLALEGISGISASELNGIMRSGGLQAVDARMVTEQQNREGYRNAIFGGDISQMGKFMDDDQKRNLQMAAGKYYARNSNDITGGGAFSTMLGGINAAGQIGYGGLQGIENALGEEHSSKFMIEYLTQTGEHDAAANLLLQSIADNTAVPPQIIIDGKVDDGDGVAVLQVEIQTLIDAAMEE